MAAEADADEFASTPASEQPEEPQPAVSESEEREAYEHWGYLFKPDRTGTDKLKALLRALKDLMNERYDRNDHPGQPEPDLTPTQLAHFYRDLHGNYDQLFLGTPHESIAFIYKSLGCLHSLQPTHHSHAIAFTDPTVPALKTEGWIMWQTIQLLLGPEEHSGFLREAVSKWDVKDPVTGDVFPKILPRRCFPETPDKHMVAWYEGVSERLRKEAEEEQRVKTAEPEHEPDAAPPRRSHALEHRRRRDDEDDTASLDSRATAIAYFRNPLYRRHDGRPSIVRGTSNRPDVSPRQSMMIRGKEAATSFGHIVKNVGNPHLWDGGSRSGSANGGRRRRSMADTPGSGRGTAGDGLWPSGRQEQRRPSSSVSGEGGGRRRRSRDPLDDGRGSSLNPDSVRHSRRPSAGNAHSRRDSQDVPSRASRSHDPTPNQRESKEGEDYFSGYTDPARRRERSEERSPREQTPRPSEASPGHDAEAAAAAGLAGAAAGAASTADSHATGGSAAAHHPTPPFGVSFEPSTSPLFAAQVARQPQPFQPAAGRPSSYGGMPRPEDYYRPAAQRLRDEEHSGRRSSNASSGSRPSGNSRPRADSRRHDEYDSRPGSSGGGDEQRRHHHHHDRHEADRRQSADPPDSRRRFHDSRRGDPEYRTRRDHERSRHHHEQPHDRHSGSHEPGRHGDDPRRRSATYAPPSDNRRDYSPAGAQDRDERSGDRPPPKQARFADEPDPGRDRRDHRDRDRPRNRENDRGRDEQDYDAPEDDLFDSEDERYDRRPPRSSSGRRKHSSRSRSRSRRRD